MNFLRAKIFDSTLRDGAQAEGISFLVGDKIKIAKALDDLGVDFIEAGNPASNQKDMEFFHVAKRFIYLSNFPTIISSSSIMKQTVGFV